MGGSGGSLRGTRWSPRGPWGLWGCWEALRGGTGRLLGITGQVSARHWAMLGVSGTFWRRFPSLTTASPRPPSSPPSGHTAPGGTHGRRVVPHPLPAPGITGGTDGLQHGRALRALHQVGGHGGAWIWGVWGGYGDGLQHGWALWILHWGGSWSWEGIWGCRGGGIQWGWGVLRGAGGGGNKDILWLWGGGMYGAGGDTGTWGCAGLAGGI